MQELIKFQNNKKFTIFTKNKKMDIIDEITTSNENENEVVKEPVIGKYTPSQKMIEFVTIKGNIKYHTNEAIISAETFAGDRYKDVKLVLTICDNNTVNFDEVETSKTTEEERGRFLEMICEREIVPLRTGNFALSAIFKATENAQDKDVSLYLTVEHVTPYNKLKSLFEDEVVVSDEQVSKINSLFDFLEEEEPVNTIEEVSVNEVKEEVSEIEEVESDYSKKIKQDFENAKKAKEEELVKRGEDRKKDLRKYKIDKNFAQSKIDEIEAEIELIDARLENIKPAAEPNGFVFFIGEGEKGVEDLDPKFVEIINLKFKKNAEQIINVIKGTTFVVKIAKKDTHEFELTQDILDVLSKISDEHFSITETAGEFRYTGELKWHGLLEKMLKLGFEQDPIFDKKCGSNSYASDNEGEQEANPEEAGI